MARGMLETHVERPRTAIPRHNASRWLEGAGFYTLVFGLVAFAATVLVGIGGFAAVVANRLTWATFLRPSLRVAEAVTAVTFLVGVSLRLGALYTRHRSEPSLCADDCGRFPRESPVVLERRDEES